VRKIKYRQKLKDAYVSRYGEVFHYWGYIDGGFVSPVGLNVSSEESEQFTGLQDKNGIDIYEGDIVKSDCYSGGAWFGRNQPRTKYVIRYNNYKGSFCFKVTDTQDDSNSMEVIGNIHENEELLCED
jgi:uncharacterized phage protein (TIGR01671 family)